MQIFTDLMKEVDKYMVIVEDVNSPLEDINFTTGQIIQTKKYTGEH